MTTEAPGILEHALALILLDMKKDEAFADIYPVEDREHVRAQAERYAREAIERGYRLALVAAVEECEKYAKGTDEPLRSALMQVAVRIAQRADEAKGLK